MPEHLHDLDDVAADLDVDLADKQPVTVDQLLDLRAAALHADRIGKYTDEFDHLDDAQDRAGADVRRSYRAIVAALDAHHRLQWAIRGLSADSRAIFDARIAREDRPSR